MTASALTLSRNLSSESFPHERFSRNNLINLCDEVCRIDAEGPSNLGEFDNVESAFSSFILRDKRLGTIQAGRQLSLSQAPFLAGLHKQFPKPLIVRVAHGIRHTGSEYKTLHGINPKQVVHEKLANTVSDFLTGSFLGREDHGQDGTVRGDQFVLRAGAFAESRIAHSL